ncbi:hypothetical protein K1718_02480 [Roseibium porphyridii]|uniref:Uncharacterized protein n=1 Tax=Roseibium porphyridii TaxID=2866279 RepID=A0ABY8F6X6_9HYPH|nr:MULTISPECIES: hypothetical protein [Stappiaceae]QFT29246.1 hypothetical protein FIV00_01995 [Labrenzia sp. THAF82]WFE90234.1 hypothetical protein K1718_02480 [Roseibium sp. KMA01]
MMIEPRSTATIKALASLAELSANQLEEGVSVEEVIATLRKAAEAVRIVVDADEQDQADFDNEDLAQDLTPMDLSAGENGVDADKEAETAEAEEPVLNAG